MTIDSKTQVHVKINAKKIKTPEAVQTPAVTLTRDELVSLFDNSGCNQSICELRAQVVCRVQEKSSLH
jgi:aerobic-type carbon monoxide dehydrogenase small subunit (CoxS/CutS family)